MEEINDLAKKSYSTVQKLLELAKKLSQAVTRTGCHDDLSVDYRSYFNSLGATICEFPTSIETARYGKSIGNTIVMGAPNIVCGGSQLGSIAAIDLVKEGLCDVSVSDYYYPALSNSIWSLHDYKVIDFAKAWSLISSAPAEALNLKSKGKLDLGYWADFNVLEPVQRSIEATLCQGQPPYMAGKLASIILNSRDD